MRWRVTRAERLTVASSTMGNPCRSDCCSATLSLAQHRSTFVDLDQCRSCPDGLGLLPLQASPAVPATWKGLSHAKRENRADRDDDGPEEAEGLPITEWWKPQTAALQTLCGEALTLTEARLRKQADLLHALAGAKGLYGRAEGSDQLRPRSSGPAPRAMPRGRSPPCAGHLVPRRDAGGCRP